MFELIVAALIILALTRFPLDFSPQLAGVAGDWREIALPKEKAWEKYVFFKKGGGDAPQPDPAIGQAAVKQAQLGEDWLTFAREQFAKSDVRQGELDDLTKRVGEQQLATQDKSNQFADEDRARYKEVFQPLQDDFVERAKNFDSPEKQAEAAAAARADVLTSSAAQRSSMERQAAAVGVNPASGRFAGINRAGELSTALGAAGAQNNARKIVRDQAIGMRADAINIGAGLPAQSAALTGMGLTAGNAALAGSQGAAANFRANTGIMGQGFQAGMTGYNNQAGILTNLHSSQLNAWNMQRQANAQDANALFSGIGTIVGAGAAMAPMMSSKKVKEDKRPVDGALEAVEKMPVEKWNYKEGMGDGGEHIGPYAEDFQKHTGMGDGKTINIIDAIGVNMKATKELAEKVSHLASAMKSQARQSGLGGMR